MMNYKKLVLLALFISCLGISFQLVNVPKASAAPSTFTDGTEDFYKITFTEDDFFSTYSMPVEDPQPPYKTAWRDEFDIVELKIDGQDFNITFDVPFQNPWDPFSRKDKVEIRFYQQFDSLTYHTSNGDFYPFYQVLVLYMHSMDMEPVVVLQHVSYPSMYPRFEDTSSSIPWALSFGSYWTGTDFGSRTQYIEIGHISGNTIHGTIDPNAFNVSECENIIAASYCVSGYDLFIDFAPDSYNFLLSLESESLPGYDIIIFFGISIGICIFLIFVNKFKCSTK
ncbi:MAG: hypothetical protein JW891_09610 [Candidatus Lokiarchaeota archaeon]|nr:hypothetical protein [Candidatus Lokiarchaeota archaeon]